MKPEHPVKILLVDDRPENLLALEVMLAKKNYELVKAMSGKEALKILLKEQDFALILMDALMPIMDGFETAALIRQSEKLKYVPIIFLTAQMNAPDSIFKGYQLGAVDYMLKPISAEILKAKVAVFVDLYRKNNELLAQEAILKIKMNQLAEAQWLAHVGSWEWDITTNKIEWSDELYRIFGLHPQQFDATYESFLKHIHPDDQTHVNSIIQQAYKDHKPFNFFHKLMRKDGEIRILNSIGKVITDSKGNIKMIGTAQDITEQKQAEEQALRLIKEKNDAERAKLVAEEAAKSKQQFLANMSHEIRTPMNAIIGFTKVILKTDLNEKQREYLNAIKVSGDSLIVLINDILDLAKVDAGKMTFEKSPFKLATSISSILLLFDTKIKESNLELITSYDDTIPEVIAGDRVRLQQIIINLLSNAIKFTPKGTITLSVRLINEDKENVTIEFSVTDTGIGIAENKIEKIFDSFQQATSRTTRLFGGSGLGLAIVKQLVEAQNGKISVKSKIG
ncbi:MAG TPA: ATP-binding protein, partial [Bacteroidia bacterium]|nr:ATP-binding protein [Bacteroidia bacterium]